MGFGKSNYNGNTGDGIFLDTVKIERVVPIYDSKPKWASKPIDLGLEICWKVDTGTAQFETSMTIICKAKKDDLGRVQGYTGDFKIDRVWEKAEANAWEPTEDMKIPEEALRDLIGREIRILRYRNTNSTPEKMKTSSWDLVGHADGRDDDYLRNKFLEDAANGFPRNYQASPDQLTRAFGSPF